MLQCSKKSGSWLGKSHLHLNYKHTPNVWWKSAETKFSDIEITARQESTQMYNWLKPDLGEIQLKGFPFLDRPPAPGSICDANSSRRIGFSDRSHISSQSAHITFVISSKTTLQVRQIRSEECWWVQFWQRDKNYYLKFGKPLLIVEVIKLLCGGFATILWRLDICSGSARDACASRNQIPR